jgi:hypothetical protein
VKKLIIPFLFLVLVLSFLMPVLIKVRPECRSQFGSCPKAVESEIRNLGSGSLYKTKKSISKILKNNPQVSNFSFQFKLPNILSVNLLVLKPEFAVFDKNSDKTYLVDASGKIIGESDTSPLPTVVQEGDGVNIFCLNLVKGVYEMYGVSRGEIREESLVIELPGPVRVIFPVRGENSQVLLGSLRLIYAKITTEPGRYSEIDLRFKNPVLR